MALLQISEPGKFSAPHQHRLAVGIESADDILADLAQALDKTFQTETLFQAVNGSGRVSPVVIYRQKAELTG